MKWAQKLNEVAVIDSKVRFRVYVHLEGKERIECSIDNVNFIKPNIEKNGVIGYEFIVDNNGQSNQQFWTKMWGLLNIPENINNNLVDNTTTVPVNTTTVPVNTTTKKPISNKPRSCDALEANPHYDKNGSHHGYSDGQATAIGVFFSCGGEVSIDNGEFNPAIPLGKCVETGLILNGYIANANNKSVVRLRKDTNSPIYFDGHRNEGRPVEMHGSQSHITKTKLPEDKLSVFGVSSKVKTIEIYSNLNGNPTSKSTIWEIAVGGISGNVSMRINDQPYTGAKYSAERDSFVWHGQPSVEKDFILDIMHNGEVYRYVCRGTTIGGHFATIYTCSNLSASHVIVTQHLGQKTVPSYLTFKNKGWKWSSRYENHWCFNGGLLHDNEPAYFGFEFAPTFLSVNLLSYKND